MFYLQLIFVLAAALLGIASALGRYSPVSAGIAIVLLCVVEATHLLPASG